MVRLLLFQAMRTKYSAYFGLECGSSCQPIEFIRTALGGEMSGRKTTS